MISIKLQYENFEGENERARDSPFKFSRTIDADRIPQFD